MKTQAKHTATPWIRSDDGGIRKGTLIIGVNDEVIIDTAELVDPPELAKANAEFIVRAVNSHEQFVNLLERVEGLLTNEQMYGDLVDDIRDALKQAEGE